MLLLLAAAAAGPVVVDIAGMPPQLAIIRAEAVRNGWAITCEGRSGEEGVLRLSATAGEPSKKLREFLDDPNRPGSTEWLDGFGDQPLAQSCNHVPYTGHGTGLEFSVLEAGLLAEVAPSLQIARDCGYANAVIRPWREVDVEGATKPKDEQWVSLDAGENASARLGPFVCFMQMSMKVPRPEPGPLPWSPPEPQN